jgi:uncharacterized protein
MDLIIVASFLIGLGGSVHCIGMCGPLALSLPFNSFAHFKKGIAILLYSFGRIFSYTLLGLVAGIFGRGVNWFGFTQIFSTVLGLLIVFSIIAPRLFKGKPVKLFPKLKQLQVKTMQWLMKKQDPKWMLFFGMLNGLLPCGLVYMAIAAAMVAGNLFQSVLFMTFFGLGTLPAMLMVVLSTQLISITWRAKLKKWTPFFSLFIGLLLLLRGLNLNIPFISPYLNSNLNSATVVECHTP